MSEQNYSKYKLLFIIFAAITVILVIPAGLLDLKNVPFTGHLEDANFTVTKVYSDSPAENADLKKEDHILSIDGISWKDTKAWHKKPRAKIGETRLFVVKRGEAEVTLNLTYSS